MASGRSSRSRQALLIGLIVTSLAAARVFTESLIETSMDVGMIVDMHVSDGALAALVPSGIALNVATQGAQKDMNLQLVFLDRVTLTAADGKPLGKAGSNRVVYLATLIKDPAGTPSGNIRLMLSGMSEEPSEAPGPFGVFVPATTHQMTRTTTEAGGATVETQDWDFAAATGEHAEMHVKYERVPGTRPRSVDYLFYSAKTPTLFKISRETRANEVVRQPAGSAPDRVKEFTLKTTGGSYAKLFDASARVIELNNVVWMNRSLLTP